jgi:hypothetical protein
MMEGSMVEVEEDSTIEEDRTHGMAGSHAEQHGAHEEHAMPERAKVSKPH